ncbi:MAG: UvrD-helicase domain-containing protein [Tepidisphaerales bacterium]
MSGQPNSRKWTPAQLDAIHGEGSLLVSAAAGSGKTSVLAERCAYLVCGAPRASDVSRLLVVTFTEAAAMEMRTRIERTLRERLSQGPATDPRLRKQLALIDHANISTLHSLCARLLRQHFTQLGLDPDFRVLDADEGVLLRLQTARDLFVEKYEQPQPADFCALIDALGEGRDTWLAAQVIRVQQVLCSVVDREQWMRDAIARLEDAANRPLGESELGREYLAALAIQVTDTAADFRSAIAEFKRRGFPKYADYFTPLLRDLTTLHKTLAGGGYDAAARQCAAMTADPGRLPSAPTTQAGKEQVKGLANQLKETLTKGPLASQFRFTTDQWQQSVRLVVPHARVLLGLVGEFDQRYAAEKAAQRVLDFNDLERLTLQLLGDNGDAHRPSAIARELHRRIEHVLVDEYQDINEIQDAILRLLSRECLLPEPYPESGRVVLPHDRGRTECGPPQETPSSRPGVAGNLFCVGDVKQSIYGFRLADPGRFLARYDRFRQPDNGHGRVIDLQANFRSRGPLLDAVNDVFRRLMIAAAVDINYDESQELKAHAEFVNLPDGTTPAGRPIELHILPDKLNDAETSETAGDADDDDDVVELERAGREALLISRRIRELMGEAGRPRMRITTRRADGTLTTEDLRFGHVVILLRAMKHHAEQYAEVLRREGIPVYNTEGGGYFNATEIRDMVALLRLLDNRIQDIPMAAVLRSPLAAMPGADDALARVRIAYPSLTFAQAVLRYAAEKRDDLAGRLREFLSRLDAWRGIAQHRPVAELIWRIYEDTGYLAFVYGLESGQRRAANLIKLYDRARQFASFSHQGLYRFNQFLADLHDEVDASQAAELSEAEDVVRIMSIHKSKGLEFPVVFLPQLGKKINLASTTGKILVDRKAGLGMPAIDLEKRIEYPSLAQVVVERRLLRSSLAEEMRVLYVAMTRAKEELILVGSAAAGSAETWERRWFGHDGPMPVSSILGARTMLHWLGPAAMMLAGDSPALEVLDHPSEEIMDWMKRHRAAPGRTGVLSDRVALAPLLPEPAPDASVAAALAQLAYVYPHAAFTDLHATTTVTALAKHGGDAQPRASDLKPPARLADSPQLSGADRGSATHLFLQHLDFSRPLSADDLQDQLNRLVDRRLITPVQAKACDLGAVAWFVATPLGQAVRENAAGLLRELPLVYPASPERFGRPAGERADQVLIRGRTDLLVPQDTGFILVDYKTDQVTGQALADRIETYRGQLDLYREALENILNRPIVGASLVFLHPRQVLAV